NGRVTRAWDRRAGHDREDIGDGAIGDVSLLTSQQIRPAVRGRLGERLHIGRVGARLGLGERESRELSAGYQVRQPATLLLLRAEEQKGPHADRVMSVHKN